MQWNLKDLFESERSASAYLQALQEHSKKFRGIYENKLGELKSAEFLNALKEFEQIACGVAKVMSYAYLRFAKDTANGALYAKFENECKKTEENLLFFELEFCQISQNKAQMLIKECAGYEFYLHNLIKNKKHNLSQKEENASCSLCQARAQVLLDGFLMKR